MYKYKKGVFKPLIIIFAIFCGIIVVLSSLHVAFAGLENTNEKNASKFNVVFVTDESGSMATSDSQKLRYEAINLFLGLMAEKGNYVGSVSFDGTIINAQNPISINSTNDKSSILNTIKSQHWVDQNTNIGLALDSAVNMLLDKNTHDSSLPSVIVLLTDGKTDVPDNVINDSLLLKLKH